MGTNKSSEAQSTKAKSSEQKNAAVKKTDSKNLKPKTEEAKSKNSKASETKKPAEKSTSIDSRKDAEKTNPADSKKPAKKTTLSDSKKNDKRLTESKTASAKSNERKSEAANQSSENKSDAGKKSAVQSKESSAVRVDIDSFINEENIRRVAEAGIQSKNPKKRKFFIFAAIIMTVLFGAWFLGGKPYVEFGADGVLMSFVQAEDPLIYRPHDIISNWSEYQAYKQNGGQDQNQNQTIHQASYTSEVSPVKPDSSKKTSQPTEADFGYSENQPLFFGNPTDAIGENSSDENYLMVKPQYTLSYNTKTLCPNWVAWHLDSSDIGPSDRMNDFRPDPELPGDWHAIRKADYHYNSYGFDRGHVCPSADRTATKEDNSMTFLMTNMVPQSPDNNRVIWMHFENYERTLVAQGNEVYIIAGPYGTGGTSSKGTFDSISVKTRDGGRVEMNVPAYTWKVLIAIPEGTDDLNRIDEDATVIAINVPNQMGMGKTGDWEQFLCSIDYIEALTGYDFFELLPDKIEENLESKVYEYIK
ncbi:MAG: DNA/RNA non-specific endonuclease [Treponema sp.]|nr:DNA/RNA non-specific endonuclease [Treponema sp.]